MTHEEDFDKAKTAIARHKTKIAVLLPVSRVTELETHLETETSEDFHERIETLVVELSPVLQQKCSELCFIKNFENIPTSTTTVLSLASAEYLNELIVKDKIDKLEKRCVKAVSRIVCIWFYENLDKFVAEESKIQIIHIFHKKMSSVNMRRLKALLSCSLSHEGPDFGNQCFYVTS